MFNFQDESRWKWTRSVTLSDFRTCSVVDKNWIFWHSREFSCLQVLGQCEQRTEIEPKCYMETKLRAHVLVDFGQISVMKSEYDFGSVNEAILYGNKTWTIYEEICQNHWKFSAESTIMRLIHQMAGLHLPLGGTSARRMQINQTLTNQTLFTIAWTCPTNARPGLTKTNSLWWTDCGGKIFMGADQALQRHHPQHTQRLQPRRGLGRELSVQERLEDNLLQEHWHLPSDWEPQTVLWHGTLGLRHLRQRYYILDQHAESYVDATREERSQLMLVAPGSPCLGRTTTTSQRLFTRMAKFVIQFLETAQSPIPFQR